ncbi:MAG: TetR/AcrR family transcriptional regulator [Bradyrhizobiaceae bacterium]|nr:TetR/AcrR family transcriptional regulator [Bradyrhizobiaceae bacterium]
MTMRAPLTTAGGAPHEGGPRDAGNDKAGRVLAAARTLFLHHGYGETSMDAIARHAAVSKATLYSHFDSKAALFAALIVSECRHLSDAIGRRSLDEPDIRRTLLAVAHDFNNLLCSGDGLTMYRIVVAEAPRFPELGRIFYDSGPAVMIDRIAAILRRATDRGLLDVQDPHIAAIQFISLVRGELALARALNLPKASKNPADYIRASVDLFLAGYRAGKVDGPCA